MYLHGLKPAEGSVKNRKRIGRGTGSGRGGTSTRGHKGAKSRSGYSQKSGFEGGQMPLQRRVPKYGFKNINRVEYKAINLDTLESLVASTEETVLSFDFFRAHGLVSKNNKIKVLGRGELNKALEVHAHAFSGTATASIEKAGGKIVAI